MTNCSTQEKRQRRFFFPPFSLQISCVSFSPNAICQFAKALLNEWKMVPNNSKSYKGIFLSAIILILLLLSLIFLSASEDIQPSVLTGKHYYFLSNIPKEMLLRNSGCHFKYLGAYTHRLGQVIRFGSWKMGFLTH